MRLGLIVALLLGFIMFAGCLSPQSSNDLSASQKTTSLPSITLLSPVGGETFSGVVEIRWQTNETSGDSAKVDIYYTTDPKPFCPTCPPQEWHEIAAGEPNDGGYEWNTTGYLPSDLYMIKVKLVTDDYVVEDTTDAFRMI